MISILFLLPLLSWSNTQMDAQILFKQVVDRRAEMEELSREVKTLQEVYSLKSQQSNSLLVENESLVQNLILKKDQLNQKKRHLIGKFEETYKSSSDSNRIMNKWISVLKDSISTSLPVNITERKSKLIEIEKRFQKGEPALSLLWSLWALSAEEISLTKGIKYSLQKNQKDNAEVETVQLGMWKMYERSGTRYTIVENLNNQISRRDLVSAADRNDVDKIIEAAKNKNFQKIISIPQGDL